MTKQEILDRDRFTRKLGELAGLKGARAAELLMRHARTYARIQEAMCNGVEWCQYDTNESFSRRQAAHEKWTEKRDAQLEKRIRAIVADLGEGFGVMLGGDPRGCTVKLTLPTGETNDFGREGYCVPGA